mmetsp:Transcript_22064/g.65061  ORF Transcript_22064/g.65061 Transcript_22064/m.65061 type:complete len:229 (+) Transcript_22064:900-1586(+)
MKGKRRRRPPRKKPRSMNTHCRETPVYETARVARRASAFQRSTAAAMLSPITTKDTEKSAVEPATNCAWRGITFCTMKGSTMSSWAGASSSRRGLVASSSASPPSTSSSSTRSRSSRTSSRAVRLASSAVLAPFVLETRLSRGVAKPFTLDGVFSTSVRNCSREALKASNVVSTSSAPSRRSRTSAMNLRTPSKMPPPESSSKMFSTLSVKLTASHAASDAEVLMPTA